MIFVLVSSPDLFITHKSNELHYNDKPCKAKIAKDVVCERKEIYFLSINVHLRYQNLKIFTIQLSI